MPVPFAAAMAARKAGTKEPPKLEVKPQKQDEARQAISNLAIDLSEREKKRLLDAVARVEAAARRCAAADAVQAVLEAQTAFSKAVEQVRPKARAYGTERALEAVAEKFRRGLAELVDREFAKCKR